MAINYKEVVKEKGYRKLLMTTIINRFGDSIDAIAFTWLVYQVTHSGVWSAIIFGMNILPNVIVQPFAGAVVERLDKKKVMVVTHTLRGLVLIAFIAMYLSGLVNGWIMAGFTFIITSIESFNMPASTAFIPRIIRKEHLTHALSLNTSVSSMVTLVGTGVAGVIIAKAGVYTAVIIDVITFFVSALIILSIRESEMVKQENVGAETNNNSDTSISEIRNDFDSNRSEAHTTQHPSYLATLKDGISYIKSQRVILNYCLIAVVVNFLLVPINALQAPLISECYHMGSGMLSLMGMTCSIGSIIGSVMIPVISSKLGMKKSMVYFGCLMGLGIILVPMGGMFEANVMKYIFCGLCCIIMVGSSAILSGMINVSLIANIEEKYLARAAGVFTAAVTGSMPVASALVSWAKLRLETGMLIRVGGIATLAFFIILVIVNPELEIKKGTENEDKTAGEYQEIQKGQRAYAGENG